MTAMALVKDHVPGRKRMRWLVGVAAFALLGMLSCVASAQDSSNALTGVEYSTLSGNRVLVRLVHSAPVSSPQHFVIKDPARVVVDLPSTGLSLRESSVSIGIGAVDSVSAVEAQGRTRVVLRLTESVAYDVSANGNVVEVALASPSGSTESGSASRSSVSGAAIAGIDFRRTESGGAQILINLSDESMSVDVGREGNKTIVDFPGATVPEELVRRLDVTDFATPANFVDTRVRGNSAQVVITGAGAYEQLAYQTGSLFTVELNPLTPEEQARRAREEPVYTGDRLSLNFQDIEVRAVLQLIADFTGLNLVVSDSVSGSITLRLQNVPWDQALDIILKTKGLDKRQTGNVLLIAPAAEIAQRERLELETQQQIEELAPLRSEFIQVNYATAADLASLVSSGDTSLLSSRGSVTVDSRTNTLIVKDTDANLSQVRSLVTRLDVPVDQVLIESRIVIASDDFSRDLGVRFGYSYTSDTDYATDPNFTVGGGSQTLNSPPSGSESMLVDLPVAAAGNLGLAVGRIGSYLLQLELSAMEIEGNGTIISSPRVVTANQAEATIEQGIEIPYSTVSDSGTETQFKKAVLGLTVTPQITPDDRVLMELEVSKDSIGEATPDGPAINTQSVSTSVLVDNGETIVLGGVYEQTKSNQVRRVPFFGELPILGHLFRSTQKVDDKSELLIFVTPKIVKENLALN